MPANPKYLTASPLQRTLKITAGFIGGYLVTLAIHEFIMIFFSKKDIFVTMHFTAYLLWAVLLIIAFLSTNGWKIWGWYLLLSAIFFSPWIYQLFFK